MKPSDLGFNSQRFPDWRCYPGFNQLETALEIANAKERFFVLNAGTGVGKSPTYAAAGRLLGPTSRYLVLVGTKGLQAQVLGDGLVDRLVYGHRNYSCMARSRFGTLVDDADADDPDFRCAMPRDRCSYLGDVAAAVASRSVIANNAYWMSIGRYSDPGLLGEFDYLVIDEAHDAGPWLAKAVSIHISPGRLRKYLGVRDPKIPRHAKIEDWLPWAKEYGERVLEQRPHVAREDKKRFERLASDIAQLIEVSSPEEFAHAGLKEPWIVTLNSNDTLGHGVSFTPRWGSDFAERYLFRNIPKVLLTSATVTPQHARYLGIPDDQMRYREIPSPFDVRRRPVVWIPTTRVDYRMTPGQKWKLSQRVDEVIEAAIVQGAGNGVIQTGSYERTQEIIKGSRFAPVIITHRQDSADFAAALQRFKEMGSCGKFAVIASPRMVEGVDLPGNEARWQIILNVGYPNSLDPIIKARASDPHYRNMVVAETIMQKCGRPVRGAEDFAMTIVLDDHWAHVRRDCPFPEWFRAGFRVVRIDEGESLILLTHEVVRRFAPERTVQLINAT
jgi:Rad3-related DNA helicase